MGVSVSLNTSHIAYNQTYTVTYECTYTPFDVYLTIQVASASWRFKYLAEATTTAYGTISFSLTADEIANVMAAGGYPASSNTVTGIKASVTPNDIDEILSGHYDETEWISIDQPVSHVGAPSAPSVAETVSREAVLLSWGAGSAGTNNAVTGYDVQYCDSADGVTFGSWQTASGSPVSGAQLSVSPPGSAGYYRKFRVRTCGSAGADWYSDWVESANMLRRKWDAFGAWTDFALVARSSMIRAVHLSEIQARVNVIRAFYGLGAYSFTPVTARAAKVAWWAALIQEIRTAIDGISSDHEAWNTLEAGKPRIAHVAQLRRVIDNM